MGCYEMHPPPLRFALFFGQWILSRFGKRNAASLPLSYAILLDGCTYQGCEASNPQFNHTKFLIFTVGDEGAVRSTCPLGEKEEEEEKEENEERWKFGWQQ